MTAVPIVRTGATIRPPTKGRLSADERLSRRWAPDLIVLSTERAHTMRGSWATPGGPVGEQRAQPYGSRPCAADRLVGLGVGAVTAMGGGPGASRNGQPLETSDELVDEAALIKGHRCPDDQRAGLARKQA